MQFGFCAVSVPSRSEVCSWRAQEALDLWSARVRNTVARSACYDDCGQRAGKQEVVGRAGRSIPFSYKLIQRPATDAQHETGNFAGADVRDGCRACAGLTHSFATSASCGPGPEHNTVCAAMLPFWSAARIFDFAPQPWQAVELCSAMRKFDAIAQGDTRNEALSACILALASAKWDSTSPVSVHWSSAANRRKVGRNRGCQPCRCTSRCCKRLLRQKTGPHHRCTESDRWICQTIALAKADCCQRLASKWQTKMAALAPAG